MADKKNSSSVYHSILVIFYFSGIAGLAYQVIWGKLLAQIFGHTIYAISTVDEAIEILTGISAGAQNADGAYPEGSINYRVQSRLEELAKLRHEHSEMEKDDDDQ